MDMDDPPLPYRIARSFFQIPLGIFFREVKERGAHNIPKTGPVIFVCGPHNSQFVDPLLLITHAGRQVGFLAAKKSMDKFWIGFFARSVGSIPVVRPQDLAKPGVGQVYFDDSESLVLKGFETQFTQQLQARSSITVSGASVEVEEVISDYEVKLKNSFPKELANGLTKRGIAPDLKFVGAKFKVTPHVDQSEMFATVTERLAKGGCCGIFPEGGSHDRSDFLPLKPGVAMMALGAMESNENLNVKIVPVGLNYFHAEKFRSRAVIEFGEPIQISRKAVENYRAGGLKKREAVAELLDIIFKSLRSVTVSAPDFETLMVLQAARRLYRPLHTKLTIDQTLALTRRFAEGFEKYRTEPAVQELYIRVQDYNKMLNYYGIRDHQVMNTSFGGIAALLKLVARVAEIIALFVLSLPGVLLHAPIAVFAERVAKQKAIEAKRDSTVKLEGRDVIATWKILVALVLTPTVYFFYNVAFFLYLWIFTSYSAKTRALLCFLFSMISFAMGLGAVRMVETGFEILRSLKPLFLAIFPSTASPLRLMRADLTARINSIINDLGPGLHGGDREKFNASRVVRPEDSAYNQRRLEKEIKSTERDELMWEKVDEEEIDDFLFFKDETTVVTGERKISK